VRAGTRGRGDAVLRHGRMTARVGLVGCGDISGVYARNAHAYDSFEIAGCASRTAAHAQAFAAEHDLVATTVDDLLADPSVDIVLNLTPVAAHVEVTRAALAAGKHVYTEKPLAPTVAAARALVDDATRRGLRLACAPDIFLSGGFQLGRRLLDEGAIGDPLAVSAAMVTSGPEERHPNPDIFYVEGGGPMLDVGPYYLGAIAALLGPVRRVTAFASTRDHERVVAAGPRAGERFPVLVATHVVAALELESGVTADFVTSWEAPGQYVCDFAVHGTEGTLQLPDPNWFGGEVKIRHGLGAWEDVPYVSPGASDARGPGLDDFARAIAADRPHRASAELGLHVLDVAECALRSAAEGRAIDVASRCERPAPAVGSAA
jgi:predicted dehydrogenase